VSISAILVSWALLAGVEQATPQTASDDVTTVEDVIVHRRRLEEVARSYVEQLSEAPRGARLARWNKPLCVSVSNMRPELAHFVIDRIAVNAFDVGADVSGPGCKPNVIILATSDGPGMAQRLVREFRLGFRPAAEHTNLSRAALREFQNSGRPVRWWNVAIPVEISSGEIAARMYGDLLYPDGRPTPVAVRVRDGSRLRSNVRHDMSWTVVIIDMNRTDGAPLGVLADYVSMVSLAQIDPMADLSDQQTVMNLFEGGSPVRGLTSWDKDYLTALYSAPPDRFDPRRQEAAVTRSLVRLRLAQDYEDNRLAEPPAASEQP
jgi:hypothetical protein